MTKPERDMVLKVALLLAVFEGWTNVASVTARLGDEAGAALLWLRRKGLVESGEGGVFRWLPQHSFEVLWGRLVPERPCPVKLDSVIQAQELR